VLCLEAWFIDISPAIGAAVKVKKYVVSSQCKRKVPSCQAVIWSLESLCWMLMCSSGRHLLSTSRSTGQRHDKNVYLFTSRSTSCLNRNRSEERETVRCAVAMTVLVIDGISCLCNCATPPHHNVSGFPDASYLITVSSIFVRTWYCIFPMGRRTLRWEISIRHTGPKRCKSSSHSFHFPAVSEWFRESNRTPSHPEKLPVNPDPSTQSS
jgi:hypothetical protein